MTDKSLYEQIHFFLVENLPGVALFGLDDILGLTGHENVKLLAQVSQQEELVLLFDFCFDRLFTLGLLELALVLGLIHTSVRVLDQSEQNTKLNVYV